MKDKKLESINERRDTLREKFSTIAIAATIAITFAITIAIAFAGMFASVVTGAGVFPVVLAVAVAIVGAGAFVFTSAIKFLENDKFLDLLLRITDFIKNRKAKKSEIKSPYRYKLLKLSGILFSPKTQTEVFLPAMADWDEEIYEALKKDKDANLFMINVRYTYAFLAAMWQKSPIGDLIEFVVKIAKQ